MNRLRTINFTQLFFSVFTLIFFIYTFTIGINSFFRYTEFKVELAYKKQMKQQLEQKKIVIKNNLHRLNQSSEWERLARIHLNMVYPNETAYLFYYQAHD